MLSLKVSRVVFPPARGRIVACGTNPKSQHLDWFRVRWDDGEIGEYCPLEMEVRKVL